MAGVLELLKDATYIKYWLAVVVSFLGDAITRITLIYVAGTTTDAPVLFISLVVIAQLLPTGVLGALIGPLADRVSKRVMLIGSDLIRVVLVLAMIPALQSTWLLLTLIFLAGVGKAFFETARMAAIPSIVGAHSLPSAVALFQSTNHTINLVGPALGGVLIAVSSVPVVLVIDAATFAVSAVLLAGIAVLRRVPAREAEGAQPYWSALRTGTRGVLRVPSLRFLFIFLVPAALVLGLLTTNLNAQLLTVFRLEAMQYGFAHAMFGGGSILAALVGPIVIRRYPSANGLLVASLLVFGLSLLLLAPAQWLWHNLGLTVVAAWCLLAGLGSSLFQVPVANTLLADLPEELRGRGVGLFNTIVVMFTIVGVIAGGVTAGTAGVANSIIFGGGILAVATSGLGFAVRRNLGTEPSPS